MQNPVTSKSIRPDSDETIDVEVWPEGSLEVLSQVEVDQLQAALCGEHQVLRRDIAVDHGVPLQLVEEL